MRNKKLTRRQFIPSAAAGSLAAGQFLERTVTDCAIGAPSWLLPLLGV